MDYERSRRIRDVRPDRRGWYALERGISYWLVAGGSALMSAVLAVLYTQGITVCDLLFLDCTGTQSRSWPVAAIGGTALGAVMLAVLAGMKPVRWRGTEMILRDRQGRRVRRSMLDIAETMQETPYVFRVVFTDGFVLRFHSNERGADRLLTAIGDRFLHEDAEPAAQSGVR